MVDFIDGFLSSTPYSIASLLEIEVEFSEPRDRELKNQKDRPGAKQKKSGQGAQKYKIILKKGNPVYPDTVDWIPVYIPVTIQSEIWKVVEPPSRTL
jgi:hypothetical protein